MQIWPILSFFSLKKFFWHFLQDRSTGNTFFQFLFVWESRHFSFILKDILQIQNSSLWCFSLNFKYFTSFSSCLLGIWGEVRWNSYLCSPIDKVFVSSGFFHLWFFCSQCNKGVPSFLGGGRDYSAWCFLSFLDLWFGVWH